VAGAGFLTDGTYLTKPFAFYSEEYLSYETCCSFQKRKKIYRKKKFHYKIADLKNFTAYDVSILR
jgi:hypothetical protein